MKIKTIKQFYDAAKELGNIVHATTVFVRVELSDKHICYVAQLMTGDGYICCATGVNPEGAIEDLRGMLFPQEESIDITLPSEPVQPDLFKQNTSEFGAI